MKAPFFGAFLLGIFGIAKKFSLNELSGCVRVLAGYFNNVHFSILPSKPQPVSAEKMGISGLVVSAVEPAASPTDFNISTKGVAAGNRIGTSVVANKPTEPSQVFFPFSALPTVVPKARFTDVSSASAGPDVSDCTDAAASCEEPFWLSAFNTPSTELLPFSGVLRAANKAVKSFAISSASTELDVPDDTLF